jgi:hypothetical protein
MAIVPNGTRKTMVAQSFGADMMPTDLSGMQQPQQPQSSPQQKDPNITFPQSESLGGMKREEVNDNLPKEQKSESAMDLTEYVSQKLQSFGYPPRRLEQFEDEFVHEKIFPGSLREVMIVIPDKYYALKRRVSDQDFSSIIKEIQEKFGLTFVDAERKDKKISINFTSQAAQDEDENGESSALMGDGLEEVYGPTSGGGEQPKTKRVRSRYTNKQASFIGGSLKAKREELFNIVRSLLEKMK